MKFAKCLETESVPEWKRAYISYKNLKKRLKAIEKYRNQHRKENHGLDLAINAMDTETQNYTKRYTAPKRTQSATLDNRFIGNQVRNMISQNSVEESPILPNADLTRSYQSSLNDETLEHASEPEQYFFILLDQDLDKISSFYDSKEKEAEAKYEALEMQVKIIRSYLSQLSHVESDDTQTANHRFHFGHWFKKKTTGPSLAHFSELPPSLARSRLKKATTEFYRSLSLLKSYKTLNETGFEKILKKFDKTAGWKASRLYKKKINEYHWIKSQRTEEILSNTEDLYIQEFSNGNRQIGMSKLRIPKKDENYTSAVWRVGFYLGLAVALFARVIQISLDSNIHEYVPNMYFSLQIYACFFLPIFFCLGFAINTLVWTRCQISYKFIFELDPRNNLDYHEFAELPSLMLLLLSFTMYIDFSQSFAPSIPSELCPLIFFVFSTAIMTCPFPILYYTSRRWLFQTLGRIMFSYFFPVEFRDFFIADELNSLAYSFWTISYFFCAYVYNWLEFNDNCPVKLFWFTPILAALPAWFRFLQCLRRFKDSKEKIHLVNGLKYVTSIAAALVTGYRRIYDTLAITILWITCCTINSIYTSAWDIKVDWGLLQYKSRNTLLRDDIVFDKWAYYLASPINIILRFSWILNLFILPLSNDVVGFIIAIIEIYRRIQWNFFRLENEHINNCGNYRAIKEIPLPFAFYEANKLSVDQEEGHIQLPTEAHKTEISYVTSTEPSGSFYGRRDFENKQDLDEKHSETNLDKSSSKMGLVLERIRSRTLDFSESDPEEEHDDEESD